MNKQLTLEDLPRASEMRARSGMELGLRILDIGTEAKHPWIVLGMRYWQKGHKPVSEAHVHKRTRDASRIIHPDKTFHDQQP